MVLCVDHGVSINGQIFRIGMIGGHTLLQIDVVEHRRLWIGYAPSSAWPSSTPLLSQTKQAEEGFVNNLLD